MTENQPKPKRLASVDLLKAISMFLVVVLHAGLLRTDFIAHPKVGTYMQYALRLLSEGVPLFVMINGFLVLHREHFDIKKHIHKTIKLLGLLLMWSIILYVSKALIWGEAISIRSIVITIFQTNISNKYTGVLWFLQSFIALYLIVPFIIIIKKTSYKAYQYLFALSFVCSIGVNTLKLMTDLGVALFGLKHLNDIVPYVNRLLPLSNSSFVFFFLFGDFIYQYKDRIMESSKKFITLGLISWGVRVLIR